MKIAMTNIIIFALLAILFYEFLPFLDPEIAFVAANDMPLHLTRVHYVATGQFMWSNQSLNGYPALSFYPPLSYFLAAAISPLFGVSLSLNVVFVLAVAAQIIILYLILRRIKGFDRDGSLIISLFWAANPFFIHLFFQMGRFAELVSWTFSLAAIYYFMRYESGSGRNYIIYSTFALSLAFFSHYLPFMLTSGLILFHLFSKLLKRDFKKALNLLVIPILSVLLVSFWILPMFYYMNYGRIGVVVTSPVAGYGVVITYVSAVLGLILFIIKAGRKVLGEEKLAVLYMVVLGILPLLLMSGILSSNTLSKILVSYGASMFIILLIAINSPSVFRGNLKFNWFLLFLVFYVLVFAVAVPMSKPLNRFVSVPLSSTENKPDIENVLGSIESGKRLLVYGSRDTQELAYRIGVIKYGIMESVCGVGWQVVPPYLFEHTNVNLSNIDEENSFLGITYVITDDSSAANHFEGLGYSAVMKSGGVYLFKTPFSIFPQDLEVVSFSAKKIHVRAKAYGWYTIKITYFPAWRAVNGDGEEILMESDKGYMHFFAEEGEDVILEYSLSQVHYVGIFVSLVTFVLLVAFLIKSGTPSAFAEMVRKVRKQKRFP